MVSYITNAAARALCDALMDLVDGGAGNGKVKTYGDDGTPTIPADADAALGGATLLSTNTCSATAVAASVDSSPGATATFNAISNATASATGNPAFIRVTDGDDAVILQMSAGGPASGSDVEFDGVTITSGQTVGFSALSWFQPETNA